MKILRIILFHYLQEIQWMKLKKYFSDSLRLLRNVASASRSGVIRRRMMLGELKPGVPQREVAPDVEKLTGSLWA